jgi:hypothetical protein
MEHKDCVWCDVCGGMMDDNTLTTDCAGRRLWDWELKDIREGRADHTKARGWTQEEKSQGRDRCA